MKKNDFYTITLGEYLQIKRKTTRIRTLHILKLIQGAPWTEQYHCFFVGAPNILTKNDFYKFTLVNRDKSKEKQLELEYHTVWNYYIQGAPQTQQCHSSFRGAPKIS